MQPQQSNPEPPLSSFAGLLSALTAAKAEFTESAGESWTKDLPEDVATLTYERALQHHARSNNSTPRTAALPNIANPDMPAKAARSKSAQTAAKLPRARKTASVTIRMSRADLEQLQHRAAEAGLTISAYLRSCTLEVESLRSEVKQTLSELRSSTVSSKPVQREFPGWRRLFRRA